MPDYVKICFKGGWALLAANEFDPSRHALFTEPEDSPQEEVTPDDAPRRGRPRSGVR
jgi:hypothetical protein